MFDPNTEEETTRTERKRTSGFFAAVRSLVEGKPIQRYRFSVDATLQLISSTPGDSRNPSGARVQVVYTGGSVFTAPRLYEESWGGPLPLLEFEEYFRRIEPRTNAEREEVRHTLLQQMNEAPRRAWNGLNGNILGGGDFFLVRADGVIELDGRVTLRAEPDGTLIDVVYNGLIDLEEFAERESLLQTRSIVERDRRQRNTEARVSQVFENFISGRLALKPEFLDGDVPEVPVQVTASFELATGPWSTIEGEDTTWVQERYVRLQEHVWRYEALTRRTFVAVGALRFDPFRSGSLPVANRIQFHVFDLLGNRD